MKKYFIRFVYIIMLAACAPAAEIPATLTATPTLPPTITPTSTNTPMPAALWISPAVPALLREDAMQLKIPLTNVSKRATQKLDVSDAGSTWIYALVAPFPTVRDDVSFAELQSFWRGESFGPISGSPLLMSESTLAAFTALWGAPAARSARSVEADQLLDAAWSQMPSWAIIPFEEIQPKWKVLSVDGQSPIHKNFDAAAYPLKITFGISPFDSTQTKALPATNRDPSKLTTMVLTGTTALVDAIAYVMENKGILYPGSLIRDWLRDADIAHISNEVPFDDDCPYPNPGNKNLAILCSRPKYMELLSDMGMDIVELTGEHFNNRGTAAMMSTLQMYRDANIPYYGGGADLADSQKPLLLENHGNKFMFIGCNMKQAYPHATEHLPGAAPCEFSVMTEQIKYYRAQGYLPIVTFQDYEYYSPEARPGQIYNFHTMADAGAVLVSGSQGHFPQMMEFYNGVFLHYALGNLFYGQMWYVSPNGERTEGTRLEFLDRHVFYDGHYLGVELLTAWLEDFARPRPMSADERAAFLSDYFYYSGWIPKPPYPTVPAPTVTLTPLTIPTLEGTPVWLPPKP